MIHLMVLVVLRADVRVIPRLQLHHMVLTAPMVANILVIIPATQVVRLLILIHQTRRGVLPVRLTAAATNIAITMFLVAHLLAPVKPVVLAEHIRYLTVAEELAPNVLLVATRHLQTGVLITPPAMGIVVKTELSNLVIHVAADRGVLLRVAQVLLVALAPVAQALLPELMKCG